MKVEVETLKHTLSPPLSSPVLSLLNFLADNWRSIVFAPTNVSVVRNGRMDSHFSPLTTHYTVEVKAVPASLEVIFQPEHWERETGRQEERGVVCVSVSVRRSPSLCLSLSASFFLFLSLSASFFLSLSLPLCLSVFPCDEAAGGA